MRGRSVLMAIFDEAAFWRSEASVAVAVRRDHDVDAVAQFEPVLRLALDRCSKVADVVEIAAYVVQDDRRLAAVDGQSHGDSSLATA